MQKLRIPQHSFQFGEASESLNMRGDSPVYSASAKSLENMIVMAEGSVKKRFGLKHIHDFGLTYDANHPGQSHLFPFSFSDDEQYVVSIEHEKIRVFFLDTTNDQVTLASTITSDVNGDTLPFDQDYLQQYTTAQYGDVMFICHPLFMPRMLIRTGLTSFEVNVFSFDSDYITGQVKQPYASFHPATYRLDTVGTTGSTTFEIIDDEFFTVSETNITGATPQTLGDGDTIDFTGTPYDNGSGGASFGAGARVEARVTKASGVGGDLVWTGLDAYGQARSETDPLLPSLTSTTRSTTIYLETLTSVQFVSDNPGSGETIDITLGFYSATGKVKYFTDDHIGTMVKIDNSEGKVTGFSTSGVTFTITGSLNKRLSILNPLRATKDSTIIEVTELNHSRRSGSIVTLSDAVDTGGITAATLNAAHTISSIIDENTWAINTGVTATTTEDNGGYVTVTGSANTTNWQEQSFSAAHGYPAAITFHQNRLCLAGTISQPDAIWMSRIGLFFDFDPGDAADDDAISLVAATGEINEIRYLISNRDLQVFGAAGELYIPTFLNQAITPTNAQIRLQTPYGCEFTTPVSVDGATIFVQKGGTVVREFLFTDAEDAYTATAISTISSHLITGPRCMAVSHGGFEGAESYALMSNDNGDMAVFNSNRAEKRAAWTRFTTDGEFCSVCAINNRMFVNIWTPDGELVLCEFDSEIGLDRYVTGTISSNYLDVSAGYSVGDTVTVLSEDGLTSHGSHTVVDNGGTASVLLTGITGTVHAGIPFSAVVQSNPVDGQSQGGVFTGDIRGASTVVLDLVNTRSVKVNNRALQIDSTFTGKKEFRLLGYSRDPRITISQNDPLPLQLNGFVTELIV